MLSSISPRRFCLEAETEGIGKLHTVLSHTLFRVNRCQCVHASSASSSAFLTWWSNRKKPLLWLWRLTRKKGPIKHQILAGDCLCLPKIKDRRHQINGSVSGGEQWKQITNPPPWAHILHMAVLHGPYSLNHSLNQPLMEFWKEICFSDIPLWGGKLTYD